MSGSAVGGPSPTALCRQPRRPRPSAPAPTRSERIQQLEQHRILQYISGEASEPGGDARTRLVEPATGKHVASGNESSQADVDAAVASAREAFDGWSGSTPGDRALALHRFADAIEAGIDDLAELEAADAGKPVAQAKNSELRFVIDNLRFFGAAGRTLDGRAAGEYAAGMTSYVRREPVGVVGQVCPWNYPLMMAAWKIGPALAAGNTVVIKPAPETPRSLTALVALSKGIIPDGIINVVVGGANVGEQLVSHDDVDMVSVTGSTQTGVKVAEAAASGLKRAHLELGGNAPVIVHADADLDFAVPRILRAGLFNAGQDCTAAARLIVDAAIHDEFVERISAAAEAVVMGDLNDPSTTMGPLISSRQRDRVIELLAQRSEASRIVTGGDIPDRDGWYLPPTIVTGVAQSDPIVQEEIFGPVFTVQPFTDEEESLVLANGVRQGLASSIWTQHLGKAMRATKRLRFGAVWVNSHGGLTSEMPHGGFKGSGYGKDLSVYGVEDYTEIKHVMIRLQ